MTLLDVWLGIGYRPGSRQERAAGRSGRPGSCGCGRRGCVRGLPWWVTLARYSSFAIVRWMPWTVSLHPLAEAELQRLPAAERVAVLNAAQKLVALGPDLGYPPSSAVRDADRLRELRPGRAGARGGVSTAGSVMCSCWRRWDRRPRLIRAGSSGLSWQQKNGWRRWRASEAQRAADLGGGRGPPARGS